MDTATVVANLNVIHDALNRIDSDLEAFTRHHGGNCGTADARQALKTIDEQFGAIAPLAPWWVEKQNTERRERLR